MICEVCSEIVDVVCIVQMRLADVGGEGKTQGICEICLEDAPDWAQFYCSGCDQWHGPHPEQCPLHPEYVAPTDPSPMEVI